MFTGIVEELGTVAEVVDQGDAIRLTIQAATVLEQAVAKGRDLGGDREVQVVVEIAPQLGKLRVDRVRLSRALATFVAYAVRESTGPTLRIVVGTDADQRVRIEIEVPGERFRQSEVEAVLDPTRAPGTTEHRGLALALRLGRSIIELHGGRVTLSARPGVGVFSLHLPAAT